MSGRATGIFATRLALVVAVLAVAGACAGGVRVTRNVHERGHAGMPFQNVLVIGVADDYDGRAAFERELVSNVRDMGARAEAYYRIVGNQPQVNRELVAKAVRDGGFDAVLVTRIADQDYSAKLRRGSADTKATAVGGNVFNLFRYDYEELNEPARVDFRGSVTLTTDLYAVADESVVWSIDTGSSGHTTVGELIDAQVGTIAAQLSRDRLVGR